MPPNQVTWTAKLGFIASTEAIDLSLEPPYVDGVVAKSPNNAGANAPPKLELTGLWGWASRTLGIEPWGQVLIAILMPIVACAAYLLVAVEIHLGSIDGLLKNLPQQISDQTDSKIANAKTDLIKEFLSEAKKYTMSADFGHAAQAVAAAAILTKVAVRDREPAQPAFFQHAVETLDFVGAQSRGPTLIAEPVHEARVALASYRSALEPMPSLPNPAQNILKPLSDVELAPLLGYPSVLHWGGPPGIDMIYFDPHQEFRNLALVGGWQTLDNGVWHHVLFINMHVTYLGGDAELNQVKFINCQFKIAPTAQGAAFSNYVALNQYSVKIR